MVKEVEIKLKPERLEDEDFIRNLLKKKAKWPAGKPIFYTLHRKSVDARRYQPFFVMRYKVADSKEALRGPGDIAVSFTDVSDKPEVVIIGAGPAGYFAALQCLESGLKPVVLDRGKDVRARRRDLRAIQQFGEVNPHSNYCFGEGGAGTYSDGKLYTRSKKRGHYMKVLRILVEHGASEDILVDAHPHIGSNKLPAIISNIRKTIEAHGGEVHFNTWVTDLEMQDAKCILVRDADGRTFKAEHFILATGHSARDIFQLLADKGVRIEAKDFAMGIRIEHPQPLIDSLQYNQSPRHPNLPAAAYSLVCQVRDKGVFSFCMCPGGLIVPAATAPGEIVVNGMSLSRRDSPFANSGIVTELPVKEILKMGYKGPLACMEFQRDVEQKLFAHGDGSQKAPAQNMIDFINGKTMLELNDSSYIPGLYRAPLHELLPEFIYNRLREGLLQFSMRMKAYYTDEANVVAIESRTSSPVRIPRDAQSLSHPDVSNLYPCGEGAGYAGGILSAAMDGQRVAAVIARDCLKKG